MAFMLTAYMPANFRVLALENSHRSFSMRMEDVANAYWAAHEGDRSGIFRMKSEYDAVRERLAFLHDHPDLGHLEPDILEVAAQMSRVSTDLAQVYSDEKIVRAKAFLAEREAEADQMHRRIDSALSTVAEMRHWIDRVEGEEEMARARLDRLTDELDAVLPGLGMSLGPAPAPAPVSEVIPLPSSGRRKGKVKKIAAE
jgi:2-oxo-4-hydroxy-4-carboxy--5-ureidoimidazoline (OHCU) decarboxylase